MTTIKPTLSEPSSDGDHYINRRGDALRQRYAGTRDRRRKTAARLDEASQAQLVLLKFRKHRVATVSLVVLALLYLTALTAEFVAPYDPLQRFDNQIYAGPTSIHFTDETGLIVQYNSPETVAAYEWLVETYDRNGKYAAMLPPGVESWTDTGNNEAWVAGSIGYTINQYSVYAASKKNAPDIYKSTIALGAPTANNGDSRDGGATGGWLTIFKGAPNVDLAKELALYLLEPGNFGKISAVAGGLFMPAYSNLWTDDLIAADPNFAVIKKQVSVENPFPGDPWPAKNAPQFGAIRAQSIVENSVGAANAKSMFTRASVHPTQGTDPSTYQPA